MTAYHTLFLQVRVDESTRQAHLQHRTISDPLDSAEYQLTEAAEVV